MNEFITLYYLDGKVEIIMKKSETCRGKHMNFMNL